MAIPGMSFPTAATAAPSITDARLIEASLRDPEAFRTLFDRHYARVRRYAAARVGDAAEDVASETFATAFDRRHRYDVARPDAVPWLLGIATNLVRRQHRSERMRLRTLASLERAMANVDADEPADRAGELAC